MCYYLGGQLKLKQTNKDRKSREERYHHLFAYLICAKAKNFCQMMVAVLKYNEDTAHLYDADRESLTIKRLMENRLYVDTFCDEAIRIFNCWLTSLLRNKKSLHEEILGILRDYAMKSSKGRSIRAATEIENYKLMILCGINDMGKIKSIIRKDVQDKTLTDKMFYAYLNKVFKKAQQDKVSVQSVLMNSNMRSYMQYEAKQKMDKYDNTSSQWIGAVNSNYNHVEMMDFLKKENDLKQSQLSGKQNSNNTVSAPQGPRQPFQPYRRRSTRGRGRGRGRGGRGGGGSNRRNAVQTCKAYFEMCKRELKDEFVNGLEKLCVFNHTPGIHCEMDFDANNMCANKNGKRYSHNCVCGQNHVLYRCPNAWKK